MDKESLEHGLGVGNISSAPLLVDYAGGKAVRNVIALECHAGV
jgi:hypothetical protein